MPTKTRVQKQKQRKI